MFRSSAPDTLTELAGFPQSSTGAPCPIVLASEGRLAVVFYAQCIEPEWNGTTTRLVGADSYNELTVTVRFERPSASVFGPPNDETMSGHRLAAKGLKPYGAFEVSTSTWIHELERQNSVHPSHDKKRYLEGKRHFILTFHDSTLECVARGYEVDLAHQSVRDAALKYLESVDA